jgi:Ca2+-binding RTX toxin-like protein
MTSNQVRVVSYPTYTNFVGTSGNDGILGTDGRDLIYGLEGNDTLRGANGDDALYSSTGADSLEGGEGNDFLLGDAGIDTLTGGNGNDFFQLGRASGPVQTAANGIRVVNQPDILTDFRIGEDKITVETGDVGFGFYFTPRFQFGNSFELAGDSNVLVLKDGFANAAAAAKAIADNNALTADAGMFVYFNTTLGIARVVSSADLSDGGRIDVLGNLSNITNAADLSQFSARDFSFVTLT